MPCWQPRPQTHLEETPLLPEILFYPLRLVWRSVWRGIVVEAPRATSMKSGSYGLTIPFALPCFVKNDGWFATVPARLRPVVCCYGDAAVVQECAWELRTLVRRHAHGLRVLRPFGCALKRYPSCALLCNDMAAMACTHRLPMAGYEALVVGELCARARVRGMAK